MLRCTRVATPYTNAVSNRPAAMVTMATAIPFGRTVSASAPRSPWTNARDVSCSFVRFHIPTTQPRKNCMSRCKHPPILNNNGASFQDLHDQYRVVFDALQTAEDLAHKATPHGRDFQTSRDINAYIKARQEYSDHLQELYAVKNYFHDLVLALITQNYERENFKARPSIKTFAEA